MAQTRAVKLGYIFVDPIHTFDSLEVFGRALQRVRDIGYEGAEISATPNLNAQAGALKKKAAEAGIRICSLMSGWSYFNEGLCFCSPDAEIRERAVARVIEYVDVAARLGAVLVFGQMQGFRKDEPDGAAANERIAEGLNRVARAAEGCGVMVVFEPVNHLQVGFNHTVAEVTTMVQQVNSPALRPMVDTVHMNIEERSIIEPIHRVGRSLAHVHLCETNGAMLGTGHLDVPAVFQALTEIGYRGYVSVKVYREASWEQGAEGAMMYLRSIGVA
jgi:sugar phosphate isomerase/epimerase